MNEQLDTLGHAIRARSTASLRRSLVLPGLIPPPPPPTRWQMLRGRLVNAGRRIAGAWHILRTGECPYCEDWP